MWRACSRDGAAPSPLAKPRADSPSSISPKDSTMTTKQYFHVFTKCLTPGATWGHEISLDTKSDAQCEADDLRDSVRVKVIKGPGDTDWILAKVRRAQCRQARKACSCHHQEARGNLSGGTPPHRGGAGHSLSQGRPRARRLCLAGLRQPQSAAMALRLRGRARRAEAAPQVRETVPVTPPPPLRFLSG